MSWFYKGEPFLDPGEYYGFVYIITNKTNNRKYVGKKFFWSSKRKQVKKVENELMQLADKKIEVNSKKEAAIMCCNSDYIKKSFILAVDTIKNSKGNQQRLLIKSLVKRITVESETVAKVVFNSNYLISPRKSEPGGSKVAGSKEWWD